MAVIVGYDDTSDYITYVTNENGPIKNYMIHWGANISLERRTVSPSEGLSIGLSIHLPICPSIRPSVYV